MDLKKSLYRVLDILSNSMNMARGTISILNPLRNEIAIEVAHGISKSAQDKGKYKPGEGITGQVIQTGKVKAKKPRKVRTDFSRATDYEMQQRLVFVASLIRKNVSNQKITKSLMDRYGLSKPQCAKYIRRVYEEFQERYGPEEKMLLLAEHLEALKKGANEALTAGHFLGYDKLMRQYAECLGLLIPPSMIAFNDRRQQLVVNTESSDQQKSLDNMTLQRLEAINATDLIESLTGH